MESMDYTWYVDTRDSLSRLAVEYMYNIGAW
jgi:hypothetical protein